MGDGRGNRHFSYLSLKDSGSCPSRLRRQCCLFLNESLLVMEHGRDSVVVPSSDSHGVRGVPWGSVPAAGGQEFKTAERFWLRNGNHGNGNFGCRKHVRRENLAPEKMPGPGRYNCWTSGSENLLYGARLFGIVRWYTKCQNFWCAYFGLSTGPDALQVPNGGLSTLSGEGTENVLRCRDQFDKRRAI